jgi:membrane-bound inhibitor of C-type lysozyme
MHVSDEGRFAFIEAEKKMDLISSQSASIGKYVSSDYTIWSRTNN